MQLPSRLLLVTNYHKTVQFQLKINHIQCSSAVLSFWNFFEKYHDTLHFKVPAPTVLITKYCMSVLLPVFYKAFLNQASRTAKGTSE